MKEEELGRVTVDISEFTLQQELVKIERFSFFEINKRTTKVAVCLVRECMAFV